MGDLGIFGHSVADEMDELADQGGGQRRRPVWHAAAAAASAAARRMMQNRAMAADGMAHADGRRLRRWRQANRMMEMAAKAARTTPAAKAAPRSPRSCSRPCASKFADTALWVGALTTAKDGTAEVELNMPENLTTWQIKVWAMGHGTKVGQGQTEVVTTKDLIVRLQAPRFFVQKDEVVLSANVHNYLKTKKTVQGGAGVRNGEAAPGSCD